MKQASELTKTQRLLFFITVMFSNVAVMGDAIIYPITNHLYSAFPENIGLVNYILSGPPFLIVIASLCAPFIINKCNKKAVMVIGSILFSAGTVFGIAVNSAAWMAAARTLVGIGQGLINVVAVALITEVYTDDTIRARYIGFYNASMNVFGIIFGYFAGLMAVQDWHSAWRLYYLSIPMLVLVIFFIPNLKGEENSTKKESGNGDEPQNLNKSSREFWELIITFFIMATGCMVVAYFISVYAAENSIGNSATCGTALAVSQFVSLVTAVAFGFIFGKLRRFTHTAGIFMVALSLAGLMFIKTPAMIYIAYVLESAGYLLSFSYAYTLAPDLVAPSKVNFAIGLVTAAYGLAGFIPTYLITWLMNHVFKTELFTPTIIVPLAAVTAALLIDIFFALYAEKKRAHSPL